MSNNPLDGGLFYDMSSADYHNLTGSWSSSQLKDIEKDPEYFHKKYILKEVEREENSVFEVGSYFHCAILEPDKMQQECAVFTGVRRGKEWDKFKEDNKNKAIITANELEQANGLIRAVKDSPVAMNRIERSKPEVSCFLKVFVDGGNIYATDYGVRIDKYGWVTDKKKPSKTAVHLVLKVRADSLGSDFVLDLKSTTGNCKLAHSLKSTVSRYGYDLSASLYLDLFSVVDCHKADFIWTFASKDTYTSRSWRASANNILVGRAKWRSAVVQLANCIADEWVFEDSLGTLEPENFQLELLKERAEDLL